MDSPSIVISQEVVSRELHSELECLMSANLLEISGSRASIDVDCYLKMAELGRFVMYVARANGVSVGYCGMIMIDNPKEKDFVDAQQDVLYVDPDYRKTGCGLRLIRYVDGDLKEKGVREIRRTSIVGHSVCDLYKHLGYGESEVVFSKKVN